MVRTRADSYGTDRLESRDAFESGRVVPETARGGLLDALPPMCGPAGGFGVDPRGWGGGRREGHVD